MSEQPRGEGSTAPEQKSAVSFSGLAHSREFLETLAAVTSAGPSDKPVQPKNRPGRPVLLATLAVAALLLVAAREREWGLWREPSPVPQVIYGTWATRAEPYANRGFVISSDSLRLLTGVGRGVTYPIVGVTENLERNATLLTLHYLDGGLDMTLRLYLEPDTTIHLVSLPTVAWTKQSP
jgi:hypothetical protein